MRLTRALVDGVVLRCWLCKREKTNASMLEQIRNARKHNYDAASNTDASVIDKNVVFGSQQTEAGH
eukprot:1485358-Lingulodinium_polyedra.AAC.1